MVQEINVVAMTLAQTASRPSKFKTCHTVFRVDERSVIHHLAYARAQPPNGGRRFAFPPLYELRSLLRFKGKDKMGKYMTPSNNGDAFSIVK